MEKKYVACGLGNAIVDVNLNVSINELESFGLKRDCSCLIDLDKKKAIESFMHTKNPKISSGGSIANSIYTLSALCGNGAFIGTLGKDELGNSFYNEFVQNNIEVLDSMFKNQVNTGVCFVFVTPDAERTMAVFLGDSASITLGEKEKELIKNSSMLLLEMYPISNDEAYNAMREAVRIAKTNDTKIVVSFSDKWVLDAHMSRVVEFADSSDIIFCNHHEAQTFSGTTTNDEMIEYFKSKNNDKEYIITLGKDGAALIINGEVCYVDAFPTNPVDLTGAGDMFLASYLYGVCIGLSKPEALKKACYMSSKIICQVGARLDGNIKDIWNEI